MNPPASRPLASQTLALGVCALLCFAAAGVGGYGSRNAPGFYHALHRPGWAPPAWLFGPVWTLLYLLMAVAAWLVWREGASHARRVGLALFALQLALNAFWSWTFFAWHSGFLSAVIISSLWVVIVLTGKNFWVARQAAGVLFLPYLGWVTFAAALNLVLWQANRNLL